MKVLFTLSYKPYGLKNEEIGEKNFFLVFMNAAQQRMLEKYGIIFQKVANEIPTIFKGELSSTYSHLTSPKQKQVQEFSIMESYGTKLLTVDKN
jgi:hypothetical protein